MGCRSRLHQPFQRGIHGGDAYGYTAQAPGCHFAQNIEIASNQCTLGDDRHRMMAALQDLKLGHEVDVVAFTYAPLKNLKVTTAKRDDLRKHLLAEREKAVRARIDEHCKPGQKVGLTVVWEKHISRWLNKQCAQDRYTMVVKTGNRTES